MSHFHATMDVKKISYGIIIVGLILFVFPQRVTVNVGDEQVILWEGSVPAANGEFIMVTDTVDAGESHDLLFELWNDANAPMNATAENRADPEAALFLTNPMAPRIQFFVEDAHRYDILITGIVNTEQVTTVSGSLHYFEHVPPEYFTDYPYRIYGTLVIILGALVLGVKMFREKR